MLTLPALAAKTSAIPRFGLPAERSPRASGVAGILRQSNVDACTMCGQTFLVGHQADGIRIARQSLATVADHRRPLQKIVRTQTVGKPCRATGRQDVAWPGDVVSHRDRRVVTEEDRAGILNLRQQGVRVGRGDVQVLGRHQIGQTGRFVGIAGQNEGPVLFQTLPGQIAPLQPGTLFFQGLLDRRDPGPDSK